MEREGRWQCRKERKGEEGRKNTVIGWRMSRGNEKVAGSEFTISEF